MEAEDPGAGAVVGDAEGQASASGPGGQDGPGGPGGPGRGSSGEAGAVPGEAPQATPALGAAVGGSDGEPAPAARAPRPVPLQFSLLVPLRSTVETHIACQILAQFAQNHPAEVHLEVTVSGTLLAIRLSAEDMHQLQVSISTCLQDVFLLIQAIWHIVPQFLFCLTPRE